MSREEVGSADPVFDLTRQWPPVCKISIRGVVDVFMGMKSEACCLT